MNGKGCKICCRNLSQVGRKFGIDYQNRKVIKRCLGQKTKLTAEVCLKVQCDSVSSLATIFPADIEPSVT